MATQYPTYRYRVDADDVLVWADEWWIAFAQENGASQLVKKSFLGRPLWDFVVGEEICQLYAAIHARVRISGKRVVLPFRCDSPSLQRHMRLTITREDSGQLLYESVLLRALPQRYLGVLDSNLPRSNAFLTLCSCCKQALLEPSGWIDIEDIAVRLKLLESQSVPELRHTICPTCVDTMQNSIDNGNAA
jgi:hypothetical protein